MKAVRSRPKKMQHLHFVATCGAGLEELVCEEIHSFGGSDIQSSPGAVTWQAQSPESAYRACLWSRFASRILLRLALFEVQNPEGLYQETSKIDWSQQFSGSSTFSVQCTLVDPASSLRHSHYAALKVKDAVVDQFRQRTGERPNVAVRNPDIRIHLHIEGSQGSLSLDLSGESLHRRGYRSDGGLAPLKESLAAAIAYLSGVRPAMDADFSILDPMCGSGTLLIEAALILGDSAPGLLREQFGFMQWNGHQPHVWKKLMAEALEREDRLIETAWPRLIGYDADPAMVAAARKNVHNAGLSDRILIKQRPLAQLQPPSQQGIVLVNPPYGERLSEKEAVKYLYRCLGRIFSQQFSNWQLGFFTGNPDLADMLGLSWQERHRLYNGPLKCRLLLSTAEDSPVPPEPFVWQIQEGHEDLAAQDFCNRLYKNCRNLLPWTQEHKVSCFRVYDADLPEYNLSIDLYERWAHVQEYAAPAEIAPEKAKERLQQALEGIRYILNVPHSQVFIKRREKQRGKEQYQKKDAVPGKLHEVQEGGSRFLVNFTDYLDTGLFLDHRRTRAMLARLAQGKTFLNLFAYTGSATVYAAQGGANSTTSVDLSEQYLSRAEANLALNGYGGPLHRFIAADCLQWLQNCKERFGLIFVDPPTFSNSRHQQLLFDVQKDHPRLLRRAMQCLARKGILVFSTNFQRFELDEQLCQEFVVEEISEQTIPRDFIRSKTHRCWVFQHPQDGE